MNPDGVEVLDRTDDNHVVGVIAHEFELVFLPTEDRLLQQHLGRRTGLQPRTSYPLEIIGVECHPGASSTHGVRGSNDHRVVQFADCLETLVEGVTDGAARGLRLIAIDIDSFDDLLETLSVLTGLDRLDPGPDQLDAVFLQHSCLVQRHGRIQRGLST